VVENASYVIQNVQVDVPLKELVNVMQLVILLMVGLSILPNLFVLMTKNVLLQIARQLVVQQLMPQNVQLAKPVIMLMLEYVNNVL